MNKSDPRKSLKRKLFELHKSDDEISRRRIIEGLVSTYTLEEVELILAKKKPFYYDIKESKDVYL